MSISGGEGRGMGVLEVNVTGVYVRGNVTIYVYRHGGVAFLKRRCHYPLLLTRVGGSQTICRKM